MDYSTTWHARVWISTDMRAFNTGVMDYSTTWHARVWISTDMRAFNTGVMDYSIPGMLEYG